MERDRYQQNHNLFIVGMICLLICLALTFFTAFLLPHLLFGWHYNVPEFISYTREWLVREYQQTPVTASWIIFLFFFFWALIFGFIAYYSSTQLDNEIYAVNTQANRPARSLKISQGMRDSLRFFIYLLAIVILVFAGTIIFHWLISIV